MYKFLLKFLTRRKRFKSLENKIKDRVIKNNKSIKFYYKSTGLPKYEFELVIKDKKEYCVYSGEYLGKNRIVEMKVGYFNLITHYYTKTFYKFNKNGKLTYNYMDKL